MIIEGRVDGASLARLLGYYQPKRHLASAATRREARRCFSPPATHMHIRSTQVYEQYVVLYMMCVATSLLVDVFDIWFRIVLLPRHIEVDCLTYGQGNENNENGRRISKSQDSRLTSSSF